MTMTKRTYNTVKYIQAFVVEDHNEVVPYIHSYIGSKQLPFEGLTLIHFDSHPDLLIPFNMPADEVFSKHALYETMSIENWIMPLVYAGHVSDIYWLKPPWCEQITEQTVEFYVGECVSTGRIRTTCKENYFISEALYCPEQQLENKKKVSLTVICIKPEHWEDKCSPRNVNNEGHQSVGQREKIIDHIPECNTNCEQQNQLYTSKENTVNDSELNHEQSQKDSSSCDVCSLDSPEKKKKHNEDNVNSLRKKSVLPSSVQEKFVNISEKLQGKQYILDIDLDFYSTKNPFQEIYTKEQFQLLSELYKYDKPESTSNEAIQICVEKREKQLATLKSAIAVLSNDINASISSLDGKSESQIKDLLRSLLSSGSAVDFELIHEAGCTMDDTELPHHVSSNTQIRQLMEATGEILKLLPQPTLVTVARSSNDDYCPADQVEFIQQNVLEILDQTYPTLAVMPSYSQNSDVDNEST